MTIRNYSNTASGATLTAAVGATDVSLPLSTVTGDPTVPFTAALSRGTANEEIVLVTAIIGSTATVTRGFDGTTAKAQSAGATFQEVVVALDFREANNHVNATGAVHGAASQIVGATDTQTLTNKTLTAPTITSPTITGATSAQALTATAVTAASAAVAGAVTAGSVSTTGSVSATGAVTAGSLTVAGAAVLTSGQVSATPAAAADIVRKDYADGLGVSAATASTLVRRDSAGRAQVADPAVASDIANKHYVDGKFTDTGYVSLTLTNPLTTGAAGATYRVLNGICYVEIHGVYSGAWAANFVITSLPVGARPGRDKWEPGDFFGSASNYSQVRFQADGNVVVVYAIPSAQGVVVATSFPVS